MKILVTGAGGMLGADVVRAAEHWNHEVVALTRQDLDVRDALEVIHVARRERPEAIVNCAAYTDVDGAEDHSAEAGDVNTNGARNVADAAADIDAAVIYPSTDYVFDGAKAEPYVESDDTRPLSVYGKSKLGGERATIDAAGRAFVVRTSWLFGVHGGNFVETMLRLAADHGEVLVVRDQFGCPTYTAHLADAIVRVASTDAYGTHHIAGAGACSWYEFAAEIFRQSGVECRLMSCTTEEFARPAPRPPNSALGTEHARPIVLPEWQVGLASYLQERVPA
jgi:dTDP-4-dehydrorhamnose reductase